MDISTPPVIVAPAIVNVPLLPFNVCQVTVLFESVNTIFCPGICPS
jgi:hypothetical protein